MQITLLFKLSRPFHEQPWPLNDPALVALCMDFHTCPPRLAKHELAYSEKGDILLPFLKGA